MMSLLDRQREIYRCLDYQAEVLKAIHDTLRRTAGEPPQEILPVKPKVGWKWVLGMLGIIVVATVLVLWWAVS